MFLRAKDGYYKGEVREFAPESARALLASGRAEDPFTGGGTLPKRAISAEPDPRETIVPSTGTIVRSHSRRKRR